MKMMPSEHVLPPIMRHPVQRPKVRQVRCPRPPRSTARVGAYRIFTAAVFCCVVAVDAWADRSLSAHLSGDVVGPATIAVWTLTLLGALDFGPMGALKAAMRR